MTERFVPGFRDVKNRREIIKSNLKALIRQQKTETVLVKAADGTQSFEERKTDTIWVGNWRDFLYLVAEFRKRLSRLEKREVLSEMLEHEFAHYRTALALGVPREKMVFFLTIREQKSGTTSPSLLVYNLGVKSTARSKPKIVVRTLLAPILPSDSDLEWAETKLRFPQRFPRQDHRFLVDLLNEKRKNRLEAKLNSKPARQYLTRFQTRLVSGR
jgi:hypothetical protein